LIRTFRFVWRLVASQPPFVFSASVVRKLEFVHELVSRPVA